MVFFPCLILLSCLYSIIPIHAVPPASVSIGGLFTIFNEDGSVNNAQSQYVSAFMMAVNEINNKTDGIADNLLPDTELKVAIRNTYPTDASAARQSLEIAMLRIDDEPVSAVVTALSGPAVQVSCTVFNSADVLDVITVSMGTKLRQDDLLDGKYSLRTVPTDAFQGHVWQSILCQYKYTSISIFHLKNAFGSAAVDLLRSGYFCDIEILSQHAIDVGQTDFKTDILRALKSGSTVFVFFLDIPTAAVLLQQGYAYGLFRVGRQIIFNEELLSPTLFAYFAPSAELTNIMKGVLAVTYWPDYSLQNTPTGAAFRDRFVAQIEDNCANAVDNTGSYIYRHPEFDTNSLCAEVNYNSMTAADFDPYIAQTYDAVYAIAYGLHHSLYHKDETLTTSNLRQAIFDNVSFTGASGSVKLLDDNAGHCSASRAVGIRYKVLNFQIEAYEPNVFPYRWIGSWSDENNFKLCNRTLPTCYRAKFNTLNERLPSHLPPYTQAKVPAVLKIGGLFNPYTQFGQASNNGIQHLAAFLMAVKEINNKTDGIADDILPNTKVVVSVRSPFGLLHGQLMAQSLVQDDFGGTGVHAVVSASSDYEVIGASQIFYHSNLAQIHSVANHYGNNDPIISPQKLQLSESATYPGTVLQSALCDAYNYRKISIFYTNDFLGRYLSYELLSKRYCEFTVLSSHAVVLKQTEFSTEIAEAKAAGARIFVLLLDYLTAGPLLEAGHKAGLFGAGRQIFSVQDGVSQKMWSEAMSAEANVPSILKGMIGIRYLPNYSISATDEGQAFVQRWRAQPTTTGSVVGASHRCDRTRDDNDGYSLYSTRLVGFPGPEVCLGLNFSEFAEDGSDIAVNTTQTYDATMAILRGIHRMIYLYGMTQINGSILHYTMVKDIEFQGVSGYVDFNEGMPSVHYYGRGDRESGLYYEVVNFNSDKFENTSGAEAFVRIGLWEANMGYAACVTDDDKGGGDGMDKRKPIESLPAGCHRPIYNCRNQYTPVKETPSPKIIYLSNAAKGVMIALAAVLLLLTLLFIYFAYKHRKKAIMETTQPRILYVLFVGGFLAAGRVLVVTLPLNDGTCIASFWMAHLGFALVLGALWAKIWRVHRIVSNRNFRKKRIRLTQVGVLKILAVIIGLFMAYMVVVTIYGRPYASYVETVEFNRRTKYPVCTYENGVYYAIMYLIELVAVVYGVWLCWQFKAVSDNNESKCSIMGVFIIATVFGLVLPMLYFVKFKPNIEIIILTFAIGFTALMCIGLQYVNKVLILREREEYNFALDTDATDFRIRLDNKKSPMMHANTMMSGMNKDARIALCRQQIVSWTEMLMSMLHQSTNNISSANDNLSKFSSHYIPPIDEESEDNVTDLIMTRGKNKHLARVDVRLSEGMSSIDEHEEEAKTG